MLVELRHTRHPVSLVTALGVLMLFSVVRNISLLHIPDIFQISSRCIFHIYSRYITDVSDLRALRCDNNCPQPTFQIFTQLNRPTVDNLIDETQGNNHHMKMRNAYPCPQISLFNFFFSLEMASLLKAVSATSVSLCLTLFEITPFTNQRFISHSNPN